ncbi:hypothetical protein QUB37_26895 [Microcoleus sp. AT3-A2]|uniref:hypothetical protein n=1 Tax=unclassified Microcoleus TaxID=2642155 RepID=UPI002FD10BC7
MIKLFLNGLKVGLIVNIFVTIFGLLLYTVIIENWLTKPVDSFELPLKLGTIVDSVRLFENLTPNMQLRKSWQNIQNKFSYFVIEYQLREDFYHHESPRLMKWCKENDCVAHRIKFLDSRTNQFKTFTLDDFFTNIYLNNHTEYEDFRLKVFLQSLPTGSTVIISEPFSSFDRPQVFDKFSEWVLALRSQHPQLKFEIGLQIHLQWADAFWFKNYWILEELSQFSKTHNYPWGVSEFSSYDQIWKRRIRGRSATDRLFYKIEGLIPRRLRRAVVLHGSYIVHRESVKYGAVRFTEWGNIQQTAWFVREIDVEYDSNYELFDFNGTPTALWWAGMRGLKDGQD